MSRAQVPRSTGSDCESLDHPVGGRIRGDRPEQRILVAQTNEIGKTLPAVGEHHRQVAHDAARIMPGVASAHRRKARWQRLRQAGSVGHLRQQSRPGVRDQALSVRSELYREIAAIALHPQGDPPELGNKVFSNPNSPSPVGHSRAPGVPGVRTVNE